jgi:hypothetical protein
MDEGVPARDDENTNKTDSKDSSNSMEAGSSSKDKSNIAAGLKSNETSLLAYSSINRDIE